MRKSVGLIAAQLINTFFTILDFDMSHSPTVGRLRRLARPKPIFRQRVRLEALIRGLFGRVMLARF